MKKLLPLIFLFLISICTAQNVTEVQQNIAQNSAEIERIQKTLDKIEENDAKVEKVYDTAIEMMNIKDSTFNWGMWIVTGVFTLLGIVIAFFGFNYRHAKKELKVQIEDSKKHIKDSDKLYSEAITKVAENKKDVLKDLIMKHQKEHTLFNTSKILILNKDGTGLEHNLKMIYDKYSDTIIKIDIVDLKTHTFKITEGEYDIVILENYGNKDSTNIWDFKDDDLKSKLIEIVLKTVQSKSAFLFFGDREYDGRFKDDSELEQYSHLINFANFPATLFGNLTDLLDFRRLLQSTQ